MNYINKSIKIEASNNNSKQKENVKQKDYKQLESQIDKHIEIFKRLKDK